MGYYSWGLIDPAGKVIEGDDDDKETKDYGGSHEGLILKLGMSGYDEMLRRGYVRWIMSKFKYGGIMNMTASFSMEGKNNKQKILKMLENVKEFVLDKKQEINGSVYLECDDNIYDIMVDDVNQFLRALNRNIEKLHQGEEEIKPQEHDSHQVAMMKKFKAMHHKRD